jgi:CheY-like chemotaxis protein
VAYKVLLADDSVPAQNMGKKILIDAGYDVLTVSNGLEALRKIAETMPDIAILDIFMPGYTGLEICERLRAKADTAALPVILTVGKLEPYRPEDGEHVRSNAVIVKPFAAAELTAAVRSLIGVRREEVVFSANNPPPANVAGPLEEENFPATDGKPLSELLAEMPVGSADEPLFATAPPVTSVESQHAEEPGPESLIFNPDGGRTPFSASAVEAPPAELDVPAEAVASAVTEFHLQAEAPAHDSAEPFPGGAAVESWPMEPETAAPIDAPVATHDDAAADAQTASSEPAGIMAESAVAAASAIAIDAEPSECEQAVAAGEAAVAAVPAAEPDSSLQAEPFLELLVEAQEEVAQADVAASDTDAGGLPELIFLEDFAADGEDCMTAADEPLTQEQEARRRAFEDLFNADVPFPLEEASGPISAPETVTPPILIESPEQEVGEIVLEPESAMDDLQDALLAPAPGPEVAELLDPTPAADPVFEGEILLEDNPASSLPSVEIEQLPVEDDSSVLGDSYTVRPAEEPELPASVASPERSELVAEVAKVEALLVQMLAVRQVGEQAGHAHSETEFQQTEAAPYLQSFGGAAQEEFTPLQATAAPVPIETELLEDVAAPMPAEPEVEPELVSSPLETTPEELANARAEVEASVDETAFAPAPVDGLNQAERLHKAVELVFDRFRPLLVAAIVRELVRRD